MGCREVGDDGDDDADGLVGTRWKVMGLMEKMDFVRNVEVLKSGVLS